MLIKQIVELQLTFTDMHFCNWLFLWQNKNLLRKIFEWFLFTAKMLNDTMHLTSPYLDQITYN